jgi:methylated-DNA-[protein]-cysteine S-methyltransferase
MTTLDLSHHDSPIGPLTAAALDGLLVLIEFSDVAGRIERELAARFPAYATRDADPLGMSRRLHAYFAHKDFAAFDDLDIAHLGPAFHCEVWRELRKIPPGATRSYGDLARALGKPIGAARAVGYANSQNPNAIVVPCHRVIGSNGTLTGYAGGLERKHWLLVHEGAILI